MPVTGPLKCVMLASLVAACPATGTRADPYPATQQSAVASPRPADGQTTATKDTATKNEAAPKKAEVPDNDTPAAADAKKIENTKSENILCSDLEKAAAVHGLPLQFFRRLIQQESNFDPKSVSPAGAQGIAQFMPGTAQWRGLSDPFEPSEALYESARWLRELRHQFGNLGLAAAAYNAGPRRVQDWIAGRGPLPRETRAYVRIITGRPADEWISVPDEAEPAFQAIPCGQFLTQASRREKPTETNEVANWGPWGLQLTGGPSEGKAISDFRQLQVRFRAVLGGREPMVLHRRIGGRHSPIWYLVRVAESSRERANQLCSRLEAAGGHCLVYETALPGIKTGRL